eukprot:sb/3470186/
MAWGKHKLQTEISKCSKIAALCGSEGDYKQNEKGIVIQSDPDLVAPRFSVRIFPPRIPLNRGRLTYRNKYTTNQNSLFRLGHVIGSLPVRWIHSHTIFKPVTQNITRPSTPLEDDQCVALPLTPIYRAPNYRNPDFPRYRKLTIFDPDIPGTPIYRAKSFPPSIPVYRGPTVEKGIVIQSDPDLVAPRFSVRIFSPRIPLNRGRLTYRNK